MLPWSDIAAWFSPMGIIALSSLATLLASVWGSADRALANCRRLASVALAAALLQMFSQWQLNSAISVADLTTNRLLSFLGMLVLFSSLLVTLAAPATLRIQASLRKGEFYLLVLTGTLGLLLLLQSQHLLLIFIGLEIASLSFYVLIALRSNWHNANEASLKYFLLGALGAATFLYGSAFFYGATHSLSLSALSGAALDHTQLQYLILGGMLLCIGFLFKLALFPFYFWLPDVYQGSSSLVAGWMATIVKVAVFGAFFGLLTRLVPWMMPPLHLLLLLSAGASLIVGNLLAVQQKKLKRLFACSSISHAGYILLALAAGTANPDWDAASAGPMLYYLLVYTLMTLGAFLLLSLLSPDEADDLDIAHLHGLYRFHPRLAITLSVFLLSLAGLPPMAGFFAKYSLLVYAFGRGETGLVTLGILTTLIGFYYYLKVIVAMFFKEPTPLTIRPVPAKAHNSLAIFIVTFLAIAILVLGIFPQTYLKWALLSH